MATATSNIRILGIGGEIQTYHFPNDTFSNTTISQLKHEVQNKTGVSIDNRLIFGRQELYTVRNEREMTFGDYKILDRGTIRLDWYLVDLKMRIKVVSLRGDNLTVEVEPGLTVLEVKEMIEFLTKIDPDEIRLMFLGRQLEDDKTLWDYNIVEESTLQMVQRLRGGGDIAAITFTDVTAADKFEVRRFGKGPKRKTLGRGLNFRGTCRNVSCGAYNKTVYVRKGFYPATNGFCNVGRRITEMNCPICDKCLGKRDICGISIYKCSLRIEGKVVNGESFDYTVESTGDCFKRALSMNDDDYRDYDYLELTVRPLDLPTPPVVPEPLVVPTPPVVPEPLVVPTPSTRKSVPTPHGGPKPKSKPTKRGKFLSFFLGSE